MNILLVYPKYPDSFWSFTHVLRFISKKAAVPPLGLITVSAMLPSIWNTKLVDLNVTSLRISNIAWADYVFFSAMYIQKESANKILEECIKNKVKVVAGGPLFTREYNNYSQIDHFVLNEAEITMPLFLRDLTSGNTPQRIYRTSEYDDMATTPVPDYHLLSAKDYAFMNIQVSRGCPYSCDFCKITALLGHKVRIKTPSQVIKELKALYNLNWRGSVLIVDDNFIGNKHEIKNNLLPTMKSWMQSHNYPFKFNTETSINLADDEELMQMMVETGFNSTFVGTYSPKPYYQRIRKCLNNYKRPKTGKGRVQLNYLAGFIKSEFISGLANSGRREYWKFLFWALFRKPGLMIDAITFAVYGYHFRTVYGLRNKSR